MFLVAFYMYDQVLAFSKTYGQSPVSHLSFFYPSSLFLHYIKFVVKTGAKFFIKKHFYRSLESSREQMFTHSKCMDHICMWHQDASNSSDGLPVISGSQAEPCPQGCPQGFSLKKKRRGGKRPFFLGKSPGDEWKRKTFLVSSPETGRWKKIIYAKNLAKIQVHYAIFLFHV